MNKKKNAVPTAVAHGIIPIYLFINIALTSFVWKFFEIYTYSYHDAGQRCADRFFV